jgi:hypothetical protein
MINNQIINIYSKKCIIPELDFKHVDGIKNIVVQSGNFYIDLENRSLYIQKEYFCNRVKDENDYETHNINFDNDKHRQLQFYKDNIFYNFNYLPKFIEINNMLSFQKDAEINFQLPFFVSILKFIIKYKWEFSKNDKDLHYFIEKTDDIKHISALRRVIPQYEEILKKISDGEKITIKEFNKYKEGIITEGQGTTDRKKGFEEVMKSFLKGNIYYIFTGTSNEDTIKIINTVKTKETNSNQYTIEKEIKGKKYFFIDIFILEETDTILFKLISKLKTFIKYDLIDVWQHIDDKKKCSYYIYLDHYNQYFYISNEDKVYLNSTDNNQVIFDGDGNYELNKWVAHTNRMFITKKKNNYFLNIFSDRTLHVIDMHYSLYYPEIDSLVNCEENILELLQRYYSTDRQNYYDLSYIFNKNLPRQEIRQLCDDTTITIPNIKLNYKLLPIILRGNIDSIANIKSLISIGNKIRNLLYERYLNGIPCINSNFSQYLLASLYSDEIAQTDNATGNTYSYSDFSFSFIILELLNKYNYFKEEYNDTENFDLFTIFFNKIRAGGFTVAPSELFYQYILGWIAKDDQLTLFENVVNDFFGTPVAVGVGGGDINYKMINYTTLNVRNHTNGGGGNIHSLLMGGGKTSMVTPLTVLRSFSLLNANLRENDEAIYLILPEHLIEQSLKALTKSLSNYFPIKVSMLEEKRVKETVPIENSYIWSLDLSKNREVNNLYLISDVTMKCGFINDSLNRWNKIVPNKNKNLYIFDEIDTILNPLVSELSYPIDKDAHYFENFESFYDIIFNCIESIITMTDPLLISLLKGKENQYIQSPNLIIIDNSLIVEIQKYIKNKIIDEFKKLSNNEIIFYLDSTVGTFTGTTKLENKQLAYIMHIFVSECIPSVITLINRKDYGIDTDQYFAMPFKYADTPATGSQFSNPLIVLSLTICDYLIKKKPLNDKIITEIIEIIKNKYKGLPPDQKVHSPEFKIYNSINYKIPLEDLSIKNANDVVKNLFSTNLYYLKTGIKEITMNKEKKIGIKISIDQLTISGLDLVMFDNINKKSGFTGTPSIPTYEDINITNKFNNLVPSATYITDMNRPFTNANTSIIIVGDSTDKLEYFITILDHQDIVLDIQRRIIKTFIDVGGIFAGISVIEIYKCLKAKFVDDLTYLCYFDENDKPKKYDGKYHIDWNKGIESDGNHYYYYDHRHTTGTDAKIPLGTKGIALLGKQDRHRDVLQAIYRMRKLNTDGGHSIIFALNSKTDKIIEKTGAKISTTDLLKWFNDNETHVIASQQSIMNLHNIRSIFKILSDDDTIKIKYTNTSSYEYKRLYEPFKIKNKFFYPNGNSEYTETLDIDYIKGITNIQKIDVAKLEKLFKENGHEAIYDKLIGNVSTFTLATSQQQQQQQAIAADRGQEYPQPPIHPPKFNPLEQPIPINIELIENYIKTDERYYNQKDGINYAKNMHFFYKQNKGELNVMWLLNEQYDLFAIPFIEGIKLVDTLKGIYENDILNGESFIPSVSSPRSIESIKSREPSVPLASSPRSREPSVPLASSPRSDISKETYIDLLYSLLDDISINHNVGGALNTNDLSNEIYEIIEIIKTQKKIEIKKEYLKTLSEKFNNICARSDYHVLYKGEHIDCDEITKLLNPFIIFNMDGGHNKINLYLKEFINKLRGGGEAELKQILSEINNVLNIEKDEKLLDDTSDESPNNLFEILYNSQGSIDEIKAIIRSIMNKDFSAFEESLKGDKGKKFGNILNKLTIKNKLFELLPVDKAGKLLINLNEKLKEVKNKIKIIKKRNELIKNELFGEIITICSQNLQKNYLDIDTKDIEKIILMITELITLINNKIDKTMKKYRKKLAEEEEKPKKEREKQKNIDVIDECNFILNKVLVNITEIKIIENLSQLIEKLKIEKDLLHAEKTKNSASVEEKVETVKSVEDAERLSAEEAERKATEEAERIAAEEKAARKAAKKAAKEEAERRAAEEKAAEIASVRLIDIPKFNIFDSEGNYYILQNSFINDKTIYNQYSSYFKLFSKLLDNNKIVSLLDYFNILLIKEKKLLEKLRDYYLKNKSNVEKTEDYFKDIFDFSLSLSDSDKYILVDNLNKINIEDFNNEIIRIKIKIATDHPHLANVLNKLISFFALSICSFVKLNNSPQIITLPEHKDILRSIKIKNFKYDICINIPDSVLESSEEPHVSSSLLGGDRFYKKYMKYKMKYIKLKTNQ